MVIMPNMKFLTNNLIDYAEIATVDSDILETLPITNIKLSSRSRVTRSNSGNAISITGIISNISTINSFIICDHNFNTDVSYQLALYSDITLTTLVANFGPFDVSSTQSAIDSDLQYNLPIWFDDLSGVLGFKLSIYKEIEGTLEYFQVGRLFAGDAISTDVGASFGNNLYWKENTLQYRTEKGSLKSNQIKASKVIEFSLSTIKESERSELQRALADVGKRKDFFISVYSNVCDEQKQMDYSGIVKMTKVPKYTEFAPGFYNSKYTVEEV